MVVETIHIEIMDLVNNHNITFTFINSYSWHKTPTDATAAVQFLTQAGKTVNKKTKMSKQKQEK